MPDVPIAEQIKCVEREIRQRQRVYPRLVSKGSMTQVAMDREIECMQAVLATLWTRETDAQVSDWPAPRDLFAEPRVRRWAAGD